MPFAVDKAIWVPGKPYLWAHSVNMSTLWGAEWFASAPAVPDLPVLVANLANFIHACVVCMKGRSNHLDSPKKLSFITSAIGLAQVTAVSAIIS